MEWLGKIAEFERLNPKDESGWINKPRPKVEEPRPPSNAASNADVLVPLVMAVLIAILGIGAIIGLLPLTLIVGVFIAIWAFGLAHAH